MTDHIPALTKMVDDLFPPRPSQPRLDITPPSSSADIRPSPVTAVCPECGKRADGAAIVDAWNSPAEWLFWGEKGNRGVLCEGDGFVHFRAGRSKRIAWIRGAK
jgi:hypothetical protein